MPEPAQARLTLIISSLSGGGAERMMSALANAWAVEGAAVTLITLGSQSEDAYPLRPQIERVALGLTGPSRDMIRSVIATLQRVRTLRRAITVSRPQAVISFMNTTNLLTLLAVAGLHIPVIVAERTFVDAGRPPGVWRLLYRPLYRWAAAIVSQTRRGALDLEARVGRVVHVIPNWVSSPTSDAAPDDDLTRFPSVARGDSSHIVLGVGRLSREKGFDLLIEAFAQVAQRHPEWQLLIAGEGVARAELTALIALRRLEDRISMLGFVRAPRPLMRQADLFVLSSRFEGMPNALLEAMSEGLACVSFDCYTGPGELIEHGVNGWLVRAEDVAALSAALDTLMRDAALRSRLGAQARAIGGVYSQRNIMDQWNSLLALVLRKRG